MSEDIEVVAWVAVDDPGGNESGDWDINCNVKALDKLSSLGGRIYGLMLVDQHERIIEQYKKQLQASEEERAQWEKRACVEASQVVELMQYKKDAERYQWVINNWRVQETLDLVLGSELETIDEYGPLIDHAMEQSK